MNSKPVVIGEEEDVFNTLDGESEVFPPTKYGIRFAAKVTAPIGQMQPGEGRQSKQARRLNRLLITTSLIFVNRLLFSSLEVYGDDPLFLEYGVHSEMLDQSLLVGEDKTLHYGVLVSTPHGRHLLLISLLEQLPGNCWSDRCGGKLKIFLPESLQAPDQPGALYGACMLDDIVENEVVVNRDMVMQKFNEIVPKAEDFKIFSWFNELHRDVIHKLVEWVLDSESFGSSYSLLVTIRDRLSKLMFVELVILVIVGRGDTGFVTPSMETYMPEDFFDQDVLAPIYASAANGSNLLGSIPEVNQVWQDWQDHGRDPRVWVRDGSRWRWVDDRTTRPPVTTRPPATTTRSQNAEWRWVRDGTGWRWRLVTRRPPVTTRPWGESGMTWHRCCLSEAAWYFRDVSVVNAHHSEWHNRGGSGPRRGEYFYFMHGHMLARYEAERLSLGLGLTSGPQLGPGQWDSWIWDSYDARLRSAWGRRQSGTINARGMYGMVGTIDNMVRNSGRYSQWVDRGINNFGLVFEGLLNTGHVRISDLSAGSGGVMESTVGAMRDQIFYHWHGYVLSIFSEYKNNLNRLTPYSDAELSFSGVRVVSATVQSQGGEPNTFYTYREMANVRLNSLDSTSPASRISVQYMRMNHRPFNWIIVIHSNFNVRIPAIVRVFMMPTGGTDNRATIHMDHFYMELDPGTSEVAREELDAPYLSKSSWSLEHLQDNLMNGQVNRGDFSWGGCGWARHLNVPRGMEIGMDWNLVVMVSRVSSQDMSRVEEQRRIMDLPSNCFFCFRQFVLHTDMSAKPLKSTFTFKLVPGETFQWEIEVFYFNFKSKDLEPLSSSPQTTPRDLKVSFGFLESVKFVDPQLLSVVNSRKNTALFQFERLSPMLDSDDSKLKRTLIHFKEQGCEKVVKTLNKLIVQFHADEQRVTSSCGATDSCISLSKGRNSTVSSKTADGSSTSSRMSRSQSVSLLNKKFEIDQHTNLDLSYLGESSSQLVGKKRKNDCSKTDETASRDDAMAGEEMGGEKKRKIDDDKIETDGEMASDDSVTGEEANRKVEGDSSEDEDERGKVEIMKRVQQIIKKAKFLAVKFEKIAIPKDIIINKQTVSNFKEYLTRTPDKTKTSLLGLVRSVDDEENIGMYECWVNPELFLAHMELKLERNESDESDDSDEYTNRALSVVHTVRSDDEVESRVLGNFLSANSKDFSIKFSEKLTYQDLLRFSIRTLEEENSDQAKKFVRQTLRGFSKGNRHCGLFIQFASLPPVFLKTFEIFVKLFEEGSLNGMKLSTRKLCGLNSKNKRQEVTKLEVPIDILKSNMKVPEEERKKLLKSLLKADITFPQYKSMLEDAVGLCEVKSLVATKSGQSFAELKIKHPGQFEDKCLMEFIGAKCNPKTGPNQQHTKLTNRLNEILSIPAEEFPDGLTGAVNFVEAEDLGMIATGKKVKEADVIFIQAGSDEDREMFNKFEYSIKEHVLGNSCVSVWAVSGSMVQDINLNFLENSEIVVENVYIKSDKPENANGIRREIVPLIISGHKNLIKDSGLSNVYLSDLNAALPLIISSLVKVKGNVLSVFSDAYGAVDVDPNGVLTRRGVSVCYVGLKECLDDLQKSINKK